VGLVVVEGLVLPSTVASVAGGIASDELLLRERLEGAVSDLVGTFHGTSGREGPARSALSLILDWGDGTSGNPVDGVLSNLVLSLKVVELGHVGVGSVGEDALVFLVGPVTHVVVGHGVGGLGVLLVGDDVKLLLEEVSHSHLELLNGRVILVELGDVLHELELVHGGRGSSSESSGKECLHTYFLLVNIIDTSLIYP